MSCLRPYHVINMIPYCHVLASRSEILRFIFAAVAGLCPYLSLSPGYIWLYLLLCVAAIIRSPYFTIIGLFITFVTFQHYSAEAHRQEKAIEALLSTIRDLNAKLDGVQVDLELCAMQRKDELRDRFSKLKAARPDPKTTRSENKSLQVCNANLKSKVQEVVKAKHASETGFRAEIETLKSRKEEVESTNNELRADVRASNNRSAQLAKTIVDHQHSEEGLRCEITTLQQKLSSKSQKFTELLSTAQAEEGKFRCEIAVLEHESQGKSEDLEQVMSAFQVEEEKLRSEIKSLEKRLSSRSVDFAELWYTSGLKEARLSVDNVRLQEELASQSRQVQDLVREHATIQDKLTQEIQSFKDKEERRTCKICHEDEVDSVFVECGHMVCDGCARQLHNHSPGRSPSCPMCRASECYAPKGVLRLIRCGML